jgi:hypothetical protein
MDKSQRRVPGKAALSSGYRFKLVLALTLAVSAAGYIAFAPANLWPVELAETISAPECEHSFYSDADGAPDCLSVAASPEQPQPPVPAATDTHISPDEGRVESARGGDDNPINFAALRPGYTMAELCSTNLPDHGLRCKAGSYGKKFYASAASRNSDPAAGQSISGQLLTTEGRGLGGVRIVASPGRLNANAKVAGKLRFWTVTDSLGAYALDGLPDGEYTIRSSRHGAYQSARISARAGVNYADLVVSRDSAAVIEGRVLGSAGEPLEGVTVLPKLLGQPSVRSDDDGFFRLPVALKPATRTVSLRFQRPGYYEQSGEVLLAKAGTSGAATLDVVMNPVEAWTSLNGTVYSDSGKPLAGRAVELRPQSAQQTYTAITDRQGRYLFPVIESPADYRLIVFGGAGHKDHQQPVKLTADTDELDIVVDSYEFGAVSGQLVNQNGEPIPNFEMVLRNAESRRPNALLSTDSNGNFDVPAAPAGDILLASQSTPSILIQGLHLNAGDRLRVPLVLDWGRHEIRGIVVDALGNPVPASRVVLKWSREADGVITRATRRTAADTQGHFAFSNLGPGPHSLRIDAPGFSAVDIDHDLSRQGYDLTVRLN